MAKDQAKRPNRPPKKPERFKVEQVVAAIENAGGIVSQAARNLGCRRRLVYQYAERHPEIREALRDAREEMIDEAESSLRRAARDGEGWAVCFALKCLAKDRGYIETAKLDITSGDEPLKFTLALSNGSG